MSVAHLVEERGAAVAAETPTEPSRRYLNRELSWLAFNWRVLAEASNRRHPPLERLRFLSISASNLDEFFMVRLAGLKGQVANGVTQRSLDGRTPAEQLAEVARESARLIREQEAAWTSLRAELAGAGILVVSAEELSPGDVEWLGDYFLRQVFPVLTPLAIDPAHPFPFIANRGFGLALELEAIDGARAMRALVPLPDQAPRFTRLPGEEIRFIALESLARLFIDDLFPGYRIVGSGVFRLIRDSDIEYEEEAEDLVLLFEAMLRRRRLGGVVRLSLSANMPASLRALVIDEFDAQPEDIVELTGMVGMAQLGELIDCGREDLTFPDYRARFPERIREYDNDCFAAIRHKDIVVHHPYESFDVVVQFLEQAAADASVLAIKQTLYRTTAESPIVKALIAAAESGKSVTALVMDRLLAAAAPREVVFSAIGLREGLAYARLDERLRGEDPLLAAARDIAARASRFPERGAELEEWTDGLFPEETAGERRLRRAACLLSDIGWRTHPDYRAAHACAEALRARPVRQPPGARVSRPRRLRPLYEPRDERGAARGRAAAERGGGAAGANLGSVPAPGRDPLRRRARDAGPLRARAHPRARSPESALPPRGPRPGGGGRHAPLQGAGRADGAGAAPARPGGVRRTPEGWESARRSFPPRLRVLRCGRIPGRTRRSLIHPNDGVGVAGKERKP